MVCSSVDYVLREFTRRLATRKVDSPRLSAEVLLAFCMGISREDLLKLHILSPEAIVDPVTLEQVSGLIRRRELGEPVAYLIGYKEFYGRDFLVDSSTLIPRPDTEVLIDACLSRDKRPFNKVRLADFGCGSGCIAITLALELKAEIVFAVDISCDALKVARKNASILGAAQVVCLRADFTQRFFQSSSLNLIVSNPPYVSAMEYASLDAEVKCFEPDNALVPSRGVERAFSNGLEYYPILLSCAESALIVGGSLFVEVGAMQAPAVVEMFKSGAWCDISLYYDLAGRARVVSGVRC